jgi:hypothetical protein
MSGFVPVIPYIFDILEDSPNRVKELIELDEVDNTADADKPISDATALALNEKENSFSKNGAFNKDFGSSAGQVAEGNKVVMLSDNQVIAGIKTFSSLPLIPETDPTNNAHAISKKYLESLLDVRSYSFKSSWVLVGLANNILFTHGLATQDLVAFLFFRSTLSETSVYTCQMGSVTDATSRKSAGVYVEIYDNDSVYVNTANEYVWAIDNSIRDGMYQPPNAWTAGYVKIILQKV